MTDFALTILPQKDERRRGRIERELRALHTMDGHLRFKEILCAVLSIPVLAVLAFLVALKLHFVSGSGIIAAGGALTFGTAGWWIGRRWFALAALIVLALLLILLETVPDTFDMDFPDRKARRRAKLERAIARREALLPGMQPQ